MLFRSWNLDENGYLAVDTILIADRYDQTNEAVLNVLKKVQQLDPPGIAARDLQDCLLIQLNGKEQTIAYQIVSEYFDESIVLDKYLTKINLLSNQL